MKKHISYIAAAVLACTFSACNDDNTDQQTFVWEGSENPETTSYRNPVWEPSMAGGTVFRAASNFVAISQETQWAAGLDYACPALQSADLMSWSSNQQAFSYPVATGKTDPATGEAIITPGSYPEWLTGRISHVAADFARTIAGANYWMIYASDADNAFGAATASSGMGPYTDLGCFLTAQDLGVQILRYPHFSVFSSVNYYLGYTTEDGSYIQQLTLRRGNVPAKRGNAAKVSGPAFYNICIYRVSNTDYYLLGTVDTADGSEIRYGRSTSVSGPYVDRNGNELTDGGSAGELLVKASGEYTSPCNPMRLFQTEAGNFFVAYNATAVGQAAMPSGFDRKPMFISSLAVGDDGWFAEPVSPVSGWTAPRFE